MNYMLYPYHGFTSADLALRDSAQEPFSELLNLAVIFMAKRSWPCGYDVGKNAPETFFALKAEFRRRSRVTISDVACENNIYGSPAINVAARAWHDWVHVQMGFDFSPDGEKATYLYQLRQLERLIDTSDIALLKRLMEAEIVGQSLYYARHQRFVRDQRGFVIDWLGTGTDALSRHY